jgi:hypothetical protein
MGVDLLLRAGRSGGLPMIREPHDCCGEDGKRPDLLSHAPFKNGRCVAVDFTVADTYAPSYLPNTSKNPGWAAGEAEKGKKRKYATILDKFHFVPVAIETGGPWGAEGLLFVRQLGTLVSAASGNPRAGEYLVQSLSIAVLRGNVASMMGTLPPGRELDEIFLF